ncbi:DUF3237 domain-containing protein [Nocardia cyriacigeorgica]|uniref:DUF3237 domain-containing protein n=1 Tax=Nocardia cyriacigeorgica TaxID=135487 RepID=UPI0013B74D3D|nr:DUF3237 domain-containing protein [Nocardia cyriacigeorgica]NEW40629.1 DUF3237 domain-containing protein [Nocardia cyriacigeorgica]NEW51143.1 DUF3237 domain-containing protein [Nocardia cyriacigeorgica]
MTADPRIRQLPALTTIPLFDIVVDLNDPLRIGGSAGHAVFFGAAGGSFTGQRLAGEVLPGGGDWARFRSDGSMTLDVRLTLRTDDGALISMSYGGRWIIPADLANAIADPSARHLVDPSQYYFRTNPLFETGARRYSWLNDLVCVGSGYPVEGGIAYQVAQLV